MLAGFNLNRSKTPAKKYDELFKFDSDYKPKEKRSTSHAGGREKQSVLFHSKDHKLPMYMSGDERVGTFDDQGEYVTLADKVEDNSDSDESQIYAFNKKDIQQHETVFDRKLKREREKELERQKEQELKNVLENDFKFKQKRALKKIKMGIGFLRASSKVDTKPDYNQETDKKML